MGLALLTIVGLILLKMALNITVPRQWTMVQSVTDAYMTFERSFAQRAAFSDLTAGNSPWPRQPASTSTQVEIGRLPGGRVLNGTITRTRIADPNNHPNQGGSITEAEWQTKNPAGVVVWKLQSVLTYQISGRTYIKSRTVIRTQ